MPWLLPPSMPTKRKATDDDHICMDGRESKRQHDDSLQLLDVKRKATTEVPDCMNGRPHKRHQFIDDSLIEGFAKLMSQRYLDELPQEVLLNIFENFAEPWVLTDDLADWRVYTLDRESRARQQALIALTKTCRRFNGPATSILYHCAHLRTYRSVLFFLSSLRFQPHLAELVKQVSCPHEVLMCTAFAFLGTTGRQDPVMPPGLVHHAHRTRLISATPGVLPGPSYDTYIPTGLHGEVLRLMLHRIPALRALSITSCSPWHRSYPNGPRRLPLTHLTKLSMAIPYQPEIYMTTPRARIPILAWLNPSNLGQLRALEQLDLISPRGRWTAHLVTVAAPSPENESGGVEKYVESLTTLKLNGGSSAQWDLMSLRQSVFSPAHLKSLSLVGQGRECVSACAVARAEGWNLNRFLATTGKGIRKLSLDWENDIPQSCLLGPAAMLTTLPMLTNLTHLTISMQVLFQCPHLFCSMVQGILDNPVAEIGRLFPASLRVLRINEFMPKILLRGSPSQIEDASVTKYSLLMARLIDTLRIHWLDARRDRELWYKCFLKLERHPRQGDMAARRMLRWLVYPQRHEDVGKEFARVWRIWERNPNCPQAKAWAARRGWANSD
ncbi:hypothetical protein Daus18300_009401 [Diaporthe australafricana]|uniref:F-box domain-containing protein n=1 Tax=Diaporthe australafricana TaxID=127596 RepID=A0ABR3WEP3_9PEZI